MGLFDGSDQASWRDCTKWLVDMGVLSANHQLCYGDASCEMMASTLRDGVVLCQLLKQITAICPELQTIKEVSLVDRDMCARPQMARFLRLNNIQLFVDAVRAILKSNSQLGKSVDTLNRLIFEPSMLHDCSDFGRVLRLLSVLSHWLYNRNVAHGFGSNAPSPFGPASPKSDPKMGILLSDSPNMSPLSPDGALEHSIASPNRVMKDMDLRRGSDLQSSTSSDDVLEIDYYYSVREENEVIYEDLCSMNRTCDETSSTARDIEGRPAQMRDSAGQSDEGQPLGVQEAAPFFRPKTKFEFCMKELVETEAKYVGVLNMLRRHFIRQITTVADADKKIIFMNIKELGDLHAAMLQEMLDSLRLTCDSIMSGSDGINHFALTLGTLFTTRRERLSAKYGIYCACLAESRTRLETLETADESFSRQLMAVEQSAPASKFRLRDLLAVPMQRVLKYHLILRELVKHVASAVDLLTNGVDSNVPLSLSQAHDAALDVAAFVNEVKRDTEHLAIIKRVRESLNQSASSLWSDCLSSAPSPGQAVNFSARGTDMPLTSLTSLGIFGRLAKDGELKIQAHAGSAGMAGIHMPTFDGKTANISPNTLMRSSSSSLRRHNSTSRGSKAKLRYVFVFDRFILICKTVKAGQFSLKEVLNLAEFKVQDVPVRHTAPPSSMPTSSAPLSTVGFGTLSRSWAASAFMLVHTDNTHAYTVIGRTCDDKMKWMTAIRSALSNLAPLNYAGSNKVQPNRSSLDHRPCLTTFERPTLCSICDKLLKGLFCQGYQCETCGLCMHKQCVQTTVHACSGQISRLPQPGSPALHSTSPGQRPKSADRPTGRATVFRYDRAHPLPTPTLTTLDKHSAVGYVNTTDVAAHHSWFVGSMSRYDANLALQLQAYPVGTFLVRSRVTSKTEASPNAISVPSPDEAAAGDAQYAISLKTDTEDVKHMKVFSTLLSRHQIYYLSDTRKFPSIVDLVSHYSHHSLADVFTGLDLVLTFAFGDLVPVKALCDYDPPDPDVISSQNADSDSAGDTHVRKTIILPLRTGQIVTVVDRTSGDEKGWWKGFDGQRVGFIPKEYVEIVKAPWTEAGNDRVLRSSPQLTPSSA